MAEKQAPKVEAQAPQVTKEPAAPAKAEPAKAQQPSSADDSDGDEPSDFQKAVAIMAGGMESGDDDDGDAPPEKGETAEGDEEGQDAKNESEADASDDKKPKAKADKERDKKAKDEKKEDEKTADKEDEKKGDQDKTDEKKPESQLEKNWAKLADANRKLMEERAKVKEEREQFRKEIEDAKALRQYLKENPFEVLRQAGYKEDDLLEIVAQRVLSGGKAGQAEVQSKTKSEVELALEETRKLRQEIAEERNQEKVDRYVSDIHRTLADDQFDLLRAYPDAAQEVLKLASQYADQHNEVLRPSDAASMMQEALIEQLRAASKTKTWQRIFPAQADVEVDDDEDEDEVATKQQHRQQPPAKTLTNKLGQRTPARDEDEDDIEESERVKRAARLVKFTP